MPERLESLGDTPVESTAVSREPQPDGRTLWFTDVDMRHTASVGGKAASLGEMHGRLVASGVRIPNGFATTADTYREFLSAPVEPGLWDGLECEDHLAGLRAKAARASTLFEAVHLLFDDAP
ncbi:MAG: PEP/pyruvate-binding domain-containing protein, partial [Longimicrobiales bacterium]